MDNSVLKKRLNTYKSSKGTLCKISDDVIMEVLRAWESWPGTSKDFYQDIGVSKQQLAIIIKKAKQLVKSGVSVDGDFKEIKIESATGQVLPDGPCTGVELIWANDKIIKFFQVDLLVEFLKKAA